MYVLLITSSPVSSVELADSRHSFNIYHRAIDNYYETLSSSLSQRTKPPRPSRLLFSLEVNIFLGG